MNVELGMVPVSLDCPFGDGLSLDSCFRGWVLGRPGRVGEWAGPSANCQPASFKIRLVHSRSGSGRFWIWIKEGEGGAIGLASWQDGKGPLG